MTAVFFSNIFFFLITGVNRRFITNSEGVFSRHDIGISEGAGGGESVLPCSPPPYTQNFEHLQRNSASICGGSGESAPPPKTFSTSRKSPYQQELSSPHEKFTPSLAYEQLLLRTLTKSFLSRANFELASLGMYTDFQTRDRIYE